MTRTASRNLSSSRSPARRPGTTRQRLAEVDPLLPGAELAAAGIQADSPLWHEEQQQEPARRSNGALPRLGIDRTIRYSPTVNDRFSTWSRVGSHSHVSGRKYAIPEIEEQRVERSTQRLADAEDRDEEDEDASEHEPGCVCYALLRLAEHDHDVPRVPAGKRDELEHAPIDRLETVQQAREQAADVAERDREAASPARSSGRRRSRSRSSPVPGRRWSTDARPACACRASAGDTG